MTDTANNEHWQSGEDWTKAPGVKFWQGLTNQATAERDYSVACRFTQRIVEAEGYNIWWCSSHFQPLAWCERAKGEARMTMTGKPVVGRRVIA